MTDDAFDECLPKRKPNPMDLHVGSRVRLRRLSIGMSQEKLGEKMDLTFQQIQKYEKGINRIGASRLFQLGIILDVPIQFFFDDAPVGIIETFLANHPPEPHRGTTGADLLALLEKNKGAAKVVRALARLPDKERKVVEQLILSLGEGTDSSEE